MDLVPIHPYSNSMRGDHGDTLCRKVEHMGQEKYFSRKKKMKIKIHKPTNVSLSLLVKKLENHVALYQPPIYSY